MKHLTCFLALSLLLNFSCQSNTEKAETIEFEKARVIETMGDKKTPDWVNSGKPMYEEGQNYVFISSMSFSGSTRPEACLKASEMDGRAQMVRYIKENITASGQLEELNGIDDPGYEALTAFLSQGSIKGASVTDRFWEKREESSADGQRVLRIRCDSKIAIKKTELRRQMEDTVKKGGNEEIRKSLLNAQTSFLDGLAPSAGK